MRRTTKELKVLSLIFALVLTACSKPPAQPAALHVGGDYTTAVTLGQNSCDSVTVEPRSTVVAHTAGDTSLTLTHGPQTYTGTVAPDGRFTTQPATVGGGAETYAIGIAGQFNVTGFTATVTVDEQRTGKPACRYLVEWVGTKQGAANVIP